MIVIGRVISGDRFQGVLSGIFMVASKIDLPPE